MASFQTRTARRAPLTGVVTAFLVVLLLGGVLTSCETTLEDRSQVIGLVNQSRAAAGRHALAENAQLNQKASAWASKMRDQCRIFHSTLTDGAPSGWKKLGENVGRGGSISAVHGAYMGSAGHKANILDSSFTHIGAGAVWGTCDGRRTVFTVQVFMRA